LYRRPCLFHEALAIEQHDYLLFLKGYNTVILVLEEMNHPQTALCSVVGKKRIK